MTENLHRKEKIIEVVAHAAADFIQRESNKSSLITVTHVGLSTDFEKATIFVTVFPDQEETKAIEFLKRNLVEFKQFVKEKTRLQHIPWFSFEIDKGEKHRQRIDDVSRSI